MNTAAAESYRARFRRVLEHIDMHLDENLCLERLGAVAAFSKFHFHRQFSELYGMGVFRYVQLARLKRASYELAFRRHRPVVDIALGNGYESPEAFARVFRKTAGQSPSEFRREPLWIPWYATYRPLRALRIENMKPEYEPGHVDIVNLADTRVAALEYRGAETLLGNAVRQFIEWRRQNALPPRVSRTFNVVHRHPAEGEEGDCHYDLCATTDRDIADNAFGVVAKTIPGGRCAVLRHVGFEDTLGEAVRYLYAEWLPRSGEELRDFPFYFERVTFYPDVPESEAITDVYLPLR